MEQRLLRYLGELREHGKIRDFFQPDAAVLRLDDTLCFVEGKGQDRYEAPPFDGHGLPVTQAEIAQRVYTSTTIPTLLIVFESAETAFTQWLPLLERGEHFDTAGTIKTPRRIYPLTSFREMQ